MKMPTRETQERVFGYYTEELPTENSFKAKAYELLSQNLTDEQIEILAQTWKRMARQSKITLSSLWLKSRRRVSIDNRLHGINMPAARTAARPLSAAGRRKRIAARAARAARVRITDF